VRSPRLRPLRLLAHFVARPLPAWLLFNVNLVVWHAPVLFDATLRNQTLHDVEHATFFFTGLLFWARVIDPGPLRPSLQWPVRIAYVVSMAREHPELTPSASFSFMVVEVKISYRSPGQFGERIETLLRPSAVGRSSFQMDFEMRVGERLLADGYSVLVSYDPVAGRSIAVPEPLRQRLVADGFIVAAFLGWYFYSKMVPEFIVPDPFKVLRITGELFYSPRYALHTYTSLLRVVASVALSLLISGVIVGAGWYFRPLRLLVANRLIPILNAFPSLGWAMLAVIWFGVNTTSVIFVEVAILLPFSMISLWEGVKSLDAETLEMARSFTKGRFNILRRVILPLLFPFIFSAIRMSYGVAWKVALIAELFGGDVGLGHLLNIASQELDTALVFAIIVALIILVIGVERLIFDQFEKRAQRQRFA